MHKRLLLSILLLATTLAASPNPAPLYQGSASEVIALINQYRAENGLPPYQENSILMMTAQGQADYIASQVQTSDIHAGPGGSRPRDRAFAAGYGGGDQIFISEIAKYGMGETAASALAWWKQSPDHNPTMIASTYVDIGAGVATDGNGRWYFVAVTGYGVGGSYTPSTNSSSSSAAQQPAAPVMIPVTKADPQPDGSIVHIIRTGQTLWTLAAVYEVPLQQILELNNFNESQIVHPGDEVIVAGAGSAPTVAPTEDPEATEEPTATTEPTQAPTVAPTLQQLAQIEPTDELLAQAPAVSDDDAEQQNSTVTLVVGIALFSIVAVIVASFFIQRPPAPETSSDNDPFAPIP
jgi:uncharacterized protein YkwD